MLVNVESLDMENRDPMDMNSFLKVLFFHSTLSLSSSSQFKL